MGDASRPPREDGGKKNHNKYRKDKPWDTDDIDHWKVDEWQPEQLNGHLLEESSFATLFPKYRENYLREVWPIVTKSLEKFGIGTYEKTADSLHTMHMRIHHAHAFIR
jgi:hypothetical protein